MVLQRLTNISTCNDDLAAQIRLEVFLKLSGIFLECCRIHKSSVKIIPFRFQGGVTKTEMDTLKVTCSVDSLVVVLLRVLLKHLEWNGTRWNGSHVFWNGFHVESHVRTERFPEWQRKVFVLSARVG